MPAIGSLVIVMLMKRYPAIIVVMMVSIHTHLSRAMRRIVDRPCRDRHAHAKRQPDKGQQTQAGLDGAIHLDLLGDAEKLGNCESGEFCASKALGGSLRYLSGGLHYPLTRTGMASLDLVQLGSAAAARWLSAQPRHSSTYRSQPGAAGRPILHQTDRPGVA